MTHNTKRKQSDAVRRNIASDASCAIGPAFGYDVEIISTCCLSSSNHESDHTSIDICL